MEVLGLNVWAVIMQAVTLIILVALVKRFFFAQVLQTMDKRRADVSDTYARIESDRNEMQRARTEYEERLRNFEAESRERIQEAIKEAQALRDQIMQDSRSQGEALLLRAQEEIGREKRKALIELRTEMAELAVDAAGKILGRSIDP